MVTQGNLQTVKSINIPSDAISTNNKKNEQMKKAQADGFNLFGNDSGITVHKITSNGGNPNAGAKKNSQLTIPWN